MKSISTIIKTTILTGAILLSLSIPTMAQDANTTTQATVINSTESTITVQADNKVYSFDNEDNAQDRWQIGENMTITIDNEIIQARPIVNDIQESIITNHYTLPNGDVKTVYSDSTYYINSEVTIQSMNYINNTITINKDNNLYSFYVDDIDNYYFNEQINITMDQNNSIVDCIVDNEPQIYNTQIDSIQGDTATLIVNNSKYSFENIEGSDGWKQGDKCKAIIQDGRLLEVRPIPLAER